MTTRLHSGIHAIALLGAVACTAGSSRQHHEVLMRGGEFVPALLAVAIGDTVTWRNSDLVPHTVSGATWDSGELAVGGRFTRVVEEADIGVYSCRYHPTMVAELER